MVLRFALLVIGQGPYKVRGFKRFVSEYKQSRGMNFYNGVDDWLGSYPYEATTPAEIDAHLNALGFQPMRTFTNPPGLGLWGADNDEFVYRRVGDMKRS